MFTFFVFVLRNACRVSDWDEICKWSAVTSRFHRWVNRPSVSNSFRVLKFHFFGVENPIPFWVMRQSECMCVHVWCVCVFVCWLPTWCRPLSIYRTLSVSVKFWLILNVSLCELCWCCPWLSLTARAFASLCVYRNGWLYWLLCRMKWILILNVVEFVLIRRCDRRRRGRSSCRWWGCGWIWCHWWW